MYLIYDAVSDIPDIIMVQVLEFVSSTSLHLTCVPFLSAMAVIHKLVVSPELLTLTKAAVNPVLATLLTCPKLIIAMALLSDGIEYQAGRLPVIVQMTALFVCGKK